MYRQTLALLGFVVLSGFLGSCSACKTNDFWSVIRILEAFSLDKSNNIPSFESLKKGYEQFNMCSAEFKADVIQKNPRVAMINDFLITPMKKFLRDQHLNDPKAEIAFSKRLAKSYKRFRSVYLGDGKNVITYIKSPKTQLLQASLGELKDHQPLTLKMLLDYKREYNILKAKVQEIVTYEDVYAEEENLISLMNYFVVGSIKVIEKYILPLIKPDMVLDSEKIETLRHLFQSNLNDYDFYIKDGTLLKYAN